MALLRLTIQRRKGFVNLHRSDRGSTLDGKTSPLQKRIDEFRDEGHSNSSEGLDPGVERSYKSVQWVSLNNLEGFPLRPGLNPIHGHERSLPLHMASG